MDRMATPMMELARVITDRNDMINAEQEILW